MARSIPRRTILCLTLSLALSASAFAGIAWQGVNGPIVSIPPANFPQSMPSFSSETPSNPFVGGIGNVVLGHADIPAKDTILYNSSQDAPEPGTLVLLAAGTSMLGLGVLLRRRSQQRGGGRAPEPDPSSAGKIRLN